MVIIVERECRLANRLFLFSSFIAHALHHHYPVANPGFYRYRRFFNLRFSGQSPAASITIKIDFLYILFLLGYPLLSVLSRITGCRVPFVSLAQKNVVDISDPRFVALAKSSFLFIRGWLFRDDKRLMQYAPQLRDFFQPRHQYRKRIDDFIRGCRQKGGILIGVHIRRGDYKVWNRGAYYYSDAVYAEKMAQLIRYFRTRNKTVRFLLCSDGEINEEHFPSVQIIRGPGHPVEDLYSLARCDYIIGPPSTYSMWASFYGKVPLLHIEKPDQIIRLSDFYVRME